MKAGETRKEQARLAEQDAKIFEILSEELRHFSYAVNSRGESGQEQLDRSREIAKDAIKILVNYL